MIMEELRISMLFTWQPNLLEFQFSDENGPTRERGSEYTTDIV